MCLNRDTSFLAVCRYFGVGMDAGKYIARVHVGKQHVTLARFYTPEQAAQAVDEARIYQANITPQSGCLNVNL